MQSLIGLSAQAVADALRQRGIVSIRVEEWTESEVGVIELSPAIAVTVTPDGCRVRAGLVKPSGPQWEVGPPVDVVESLVAAIKKAQWKVAMSRRQFN